MTIITRRSFLKLAVAASAAGLIVPAFTPPREPYVRVGWAVDYIGRAGQPGSFIGSTLVHAVGEWDQIGYPVTLTDQGFPARPTRHRIYDFDLCVLREEVPARFWADPANVAKYPNVHTFMREKRFGETVAQAIQSLNFTLAGRLS